MQNDKRQPVLLALAATSLLLSPTHAALVLRGAGRLSAAPFGGDCKEDKDCASVHCFDGKCAYSGKCKKRGAACHTFAAHTCCTGVCQAVAMVDDCKRLLTLNGKKNIGAGNERVTAMSIPRCVPTFSWCIGWSWQAEHTLGCPSR
mmetsp:Transcript_19563/g.32238  ORF Transcript_19563/g.32238 Transcript_19563/m.32238 type:complete len:146 (+) Transcript_19563:101-538(+)